MRAYGKDIEWLPTLSQASEVKRLLSDAASLPEFLDRNLLYFYCQELDKKFYKTEIKIDYLIRLGFLLGQKAEAVKRQGEADTP